MTQPENAFAPRTPRAYETFVSWVEERVLSGEFVVGTVLPAERDLAAQLGISRAAVREGVRALGAMGVLDSRVGAGAAGGTVVTAVPSEALNRFLRMHVALAQFDLAALAQVRLALETLSVRLASVRASEQELDELAAILDQLEGEHDPERFTELDAQFHIAMARLSRNSLSEDLTVAIRESMKEPLRRGSERHAQWPSVRTQLNADHRAILTAMCARDADGAAKLLAAHIEHAMRDLLLVVK